MNSISRIVPLFLVIFLASCENDPVGPKAVSGFGHGIIITNEGTYKQNNGCISFLDSNSDSIIPDLFLRANGRSLGDVVQSFAIADSLGFIVVNNSRKVEVVRLDDFVSIGLIEASYPRYFAYAGSGKGYLTNGGFPGEVLVVDTRLLTITDTIQVGNQPEHLLVSHDKLFVANGKWGNDNTVSVIDLAADTVFRTLVVGDGPTDLVETKDKVIWVICQGKLIYNDDWSQVIDETASSLVSIDPETLEVKNSIGIGQLGDGFNPYLLAASPAKDILYVAESDGIHTFDATTHVFSENALIPGYFYGLGVNPANGNIFALEARGYTSDGAVHIYSTDGMLLKSFDTGIGPNGVVFY